MIGPQEIAERARKWWPEVLRAALTEATVFPRFVPRIGRGTAKTLDDFDRIRREQAALLPGDGKRYRLHWKTVQSRSFGSNRFIERISVDDLDSYLNLLDARAEYNHFVQLTDLILRQQPGLRDWLLANVLAVLNYAAAWPNLLKVLDFFVNDHVRDRYYIRELPVAVPTKFIESHKTILASLLDAILPPETIDESHRGSKGFERRYGLKYRQPLVRLRVLDPEIAAAYFSGMDDLSLPLDRFARLTLPTVKRAIILENKTNFSNLMNFLTLPQLEGTIGIFGSGFKAGLLKEVDWLQSIELRYWGDLDAHGLQIVNQLRAHFPQLRTFLMDRDTLDAFPQYHVTATPAATADLQHLTDQELALYDYLNDACIRLEQERIPLSWAVRALEGVN
ncbi:MAG: Wadjet anti-phage system protein JetD domain-containing protein [Bacteroidota bacterium]